MSDDDERVRIKKLVEEEAKAITGEYAEYAKRIGELSADIKAEHTHVAAEARTMVVLAATICGAFVLLLLNNAVQFIEAGGAFNRGSIYFWATIGAVASLVAAIIAFIDAFIFRIDSPIYRRALNAFGHKPEKKRTLKSVMVWFGISQILLAVSAGFYILALVALSEAPKP